MAEQQSIVKRLLSLLTYKDKKKLSEFYIPEPEEEELRRAGTVDTDSGEPEARVERGESRQGKGLRKPLTVSEWKQEKGKEERKDRRGSDGSIPVDIDENILSLQSVFHSPKNKDLIIREFKIAGRLKAFLAYLDGMVDKNIINTNILRPLLLTGKVGENEKGCPLDRILTDIVETNQAKKIEDPEEAIFEILTGNTILYVDGCDFYLTNETKGFPTRNVEKPQIEGVVTGPQEAFTETLRVNLSLIRKIIKNPNLTTEFMKMGKRNRSLCAVAYIDGLANPAVVKEVKRRIHSLDTDFINGDGMLEQFIEDNPFSLFPTILTTERPDRTAAHLVEGKVAILCEGAPFSKIVPTTIYSMLHSPEDAYMRFPYGTLLRYVRLIGIFFSVYLPSLYIAVTNFHQEMLPTDLLIAIAKAKENVPFPTIVEVLLMEASFELIREAGIRIPGIIGNTLGIIGALILGQAAVQANIVSPVLIIVVAITGLGNFAVPNFSFALGLRISRFGFIIMGALLGFYGITVLTMFLAFHIVTQKSFGIPYLAPVAPRTKKSRDIFIRYPLWNQEIRPDYMNTKDRERQPVISRKWIRKKPVSRKDKEGDDA